ncbi:MAG: bifunctional diaminohydroxyphosphoribosylaminopyrimidine deaminase/5-amino-6-(5-phosphoribosylamino)uracil reductase RibD [Caulobacterales bacterium]|uniref:bifunctional diaminohydroxyphosphoribosylaminopyrimidine deaminase/5-amino-6-(5-phosphoribosylamino)uracil reductase RibD n=1 Tax=Glycocaulis sp. TaxID=1969725 RepID=UPI003FA19557
MPEGLTHTDLRLMDAALALAFSGLGTTAPNPSVGCVIARDGKVIASAVTAPGGRPHAEAQALERAGEAARGADVYVTLEPCSHHGKTPPCAEALITAGVARVFVASGDPDPRVSGRGIALLREAGITVIEGVRREDSDRLNAGFFTRVRTGLPLVAQDARPGLFDADLVPGPAESLDEAIQRLGREGMTRVRLHGAS